MIVTIRESGGNDDVECSRVETGAPSARTCFDDRHPVSPTASQEELQALYTGTPAMMHVIGVDGRLTRVSDKWLSVLGYSRDEVIGRSLLDFMTPDSQRYATTGRLQEFFVSGSSEKIPYDLVTKSGAIVNVLMSATLRRNADGSPGQTFAVLEDLTESHTVFRTLAAERRRLRQIISGTGAGIWEWNVQTGETVFNAQWAEIIGYDLAEISPTTIETWMNAAHPDDPRSRNASSCSISPGNPDL
ncbi:MAG: PAS domain S-box protein [Alphaproteobacteria bacterium]|nr:PAS domain S-box protein [Alphaproteobacteria bacterium]